MDRYTLVLPLGEGGQAAVWKAIDPLEGGAVRALKIFQLRGASTESAERARREAKAVARSQHPGVLPCRSLVEDPAEEVLVLVFDYVRGRSLADALSDARMTQMHRRAVVSQIADTLAYVHGQGMIHRDIKPENVLVTDAFWESPRVAGTLKLVDFGIAAPAGNPKPLTREGGVVGTTPYLPPELVDTSGLFEAGDDLRRDVFAFGVLGWEVLVGGHPTGLPLGASRDAFAGVYLAARAGRRMWPPEAASVPELAVVRACLAISPGGRPESCLVVAAALRGVGDGSGTEQMGASPFRSSRTEIHVPPRTAFRSAPASSPATPVMQGMGRGPLPPSGSRPQGAMEPASTRQLRRMVWAVAAVAVLAMLGAISIGAHLATRSAETSQLSLSDAPPPALPPTVARPTFVMPTSPIASRPVACCVNDACRSGNSCEPAPCQTVPDGPWRLRVIGGLLGSVEIQRAWRSSEICLKNLRTGEDQCASSNTMWTKGSDRAHRVLATLTDMRNGLIEVRVVDGGVERIRRTGFSYPGSYKTTALCDPVTLHIGAWESHLGKISVFLDDP